MIKDVNEGSTVTLKASFYDENGKLKIPDSVTYRIDDLGTDTVIQAETALTPASTVEITVTDTHTALLNQANPVEIRRVTVIGIDSAGYKQVIEQDLTIYNTGYL